MVVIQITCVPYGNCLKSLYELDKNYIYDTLSLLYLKYPPYNIACCCLKLQFLLDARMTQVNILFHFVLSFFVKYMFHITEMMINVDILCRSVKHYVQLN